MKLVPLESSKLTLPELVKLAKKENVVLTRKGKPVASVRNLLGTDWESLALANNPKFQELIDASRQSYAEEGGISLEELRDQFKLKPHTGRKGKKRPGSPVVRG